MTNDEQRAMATAALHTFRTGQITVGNRANDGTWHLQTGDGKTTIVPPRPVPPRRPWWKFWGRWTSSG